MRLTSHIAIGMVRAYQCLVSPVLPMSCRYHPSCSHYACEAISRHGVLRGTWLAASRILRCHPWRAGGLDPVPEHVEPPFAAALEGAGLRTRRPAAATAGPERDCGGR